MTRLTLKWLIVFVLMSGLATPAEPSLIQKGQKGDRYGQLASPPVILDPLLLERAQKGEADAQSELGLMYWIGKGVPKNSTEAAKWYRKAAEQGNLGAQLSLAGMYMRGDGVPWDSAEAAKWYRLADEHGSTVALFELAEIYDAGEGVTDPAEAIKWYRKAAEHGSVRFQFKLGKMYADGDGVSKNGAEAVKWYRMAAVQEHEDNAQFNLGLMYYNGDGVLKDGTEAVKWFRKAAEQGNADAQGNLGLMYATGDGVQKDSAEAVKWYLRAAEQGNKVGQGNLGYMYANGEGVPKDLIEALAWTNIAAASGNQTYAINRDKLERRVGPEATLAAQQRSKEILKEIETTKRRQTSPVTKDSAAPVAPAEATPKTSGSGTIVSAEGHVLTAAHVVAGAGRVKIFTAQGMRTASVLRIDEANDLAVLKLAAGIYPVLPVAPSRRIRLGQMVATIGFPNIEIQGFSPKVTRGEISSLNGLGDDPRAWQISVPVQTGHSGGPLLDESGNLVGVVVSKLGLKAARVTGDLPQNVNYAVKSSYALALLEPYLGSDAPEPNQAAAKPRFEDMVAKAQQSVVLILVY